MKKFLTFFLTALLTFSVGWAAVTDVLDRAFTGVTGTSYSSWSGEGTSGAVYAGNSAGGNSSIQLRSTNASAIVTTASGGKVKSVTVVWNSNTQNGRTLQIYCSHSAYTLASFANGNKGTLIGTIVKGTSTSLTISGDYEHIALCSASGAMYLTSISIDWEQGGTSTVTPPTITPDGGDILASQEISMSAEDGASIYYTINGNNPTTSSTLYTAPFTLNSGATVKAIAVKDGVSSTVTSATFNVVAGVPTIAEALNTTEQFIFAGHAVVVYQHGSYLYIKDETGWGLVYGTVNGTYNNGNILNPGWKATKTVYRGLPEFGSPVADTFSSSDSGDEVTPETLTTIDEDTELNMYAFMSNLKVTEVNNGNISLQGVNFQLRNTIGVSDLPAFEVGKTYNVRGFTGVYNGTYQFYPIWAEEVVTGDPTITLDPTSLTIDDSGTNNSFTVTARNLHENDYGNVSVAHNWVFNTTLTSSTNSIANWNGLQGFNRNYRSVDGTVTVTYTGRELTATDTYTIGTEGASKTITVTYEPNLYIYCDNGVSPWNFQANPAIAMTNNGEGIYTATLSDIPANSHILFGRASGLTYTWDGDDNRLFMGAVMDNGADWQYGFNEQPGSIDTNPTNPVKYRPIWFPEAGTYTVTINANNRTFTITKEVVLTGDFTLVTDASQLAAGNEVIIVNSGVSANDARTMGEQRSDNFYGTGVVVSGALTVAATEETQIFTLVGQTGEWSFKNSNNEYLYAASSSKNYLRTQATIDDNAQATITINSSTKAATIKFNGSNTRNIIRYNPNSSGSNDIFSCYASGQQNVYIYQRGAQNASLSADKQHITLVTPAGADESEPQTFTVTGSNLTENVTLTVDNDNFVLDPTTIVPVDGSVSQEVTVTYVGESAVNENATITITSSGQTVLVYVHGSKAAVTLAQIESNTDLLNKKVTVDGQLIGVWAVNNGATKLLWAKDQDQASIDKRPARTEAQDDYMVNRMKYQHYEFEGEYDWDESNWVILDFANLDGENPDNYVGHKLANKSVTGTYDDANEYTLTLTKAPSRVNEDEQDAPEYPGYNGDDKGQHDASNYGKDYRWAYNSYMPANFMPDNLNRIDADTIAGAHSGEHALPNMQNQQLYFMNPKVMEVAHLWGVWCGSGSDKFSIYTVGMENNETVNAWDLHGAVDVISWKYNNKGGGEYSQPYLEDATAQDFHAVIVRKNRGNSLMAGVNNDPSSSEYGIYPLDLPEGGHPTAVREVNTGKQVLSIRYYNVMGVEASQPFDGVNIIVTRYTDGSSSAIKVIK